MYVGSKSWSRCRSQERRTLEPENCALDPALAIMLASAAIITTIAVLAWIAVGLGVVGVVFCAVGFYAPLSVHLF